MHSNNPTFINLDGLQQKILKLTSVILPDQVSECKDQPNPREVQPCELERHKQISEYKEEKKKVSQTTTSGIKVQHIIFLMDAFFK
jgi:hypothetical protein